MHEHTEWTEDKDDDMVPIYTTSQPYKHICTQVSRHPTTCPFCGTVCEHYESAQCHLRTSCTKSPFPTKKSYWFDPRMLAAYDKNGMTGYHADTEALMTRQRPSIRYVPMFTPSI